MPLGVINRALARLFSLAVKRAAPDAIPPRRPRAACTLRSSAGLNRRQTYRVKLRAIPVTSAAPRGTAKVFSA